LSGLRYHTIDLPVGNFRENVGFAVGIAVGMTVGTAEDIAVGLAEG